MTNVLALTSGLRVRRAGVRKIYGVVHMLAVSVLVTGCAASTRGDIGTPGDPYEQTNRQVFSINQKLDNAVALPVAKFYSRAVPQPLRGVVHNVLATANLPVVFGNDLLQVDMRRAGQSLGRFTINATLGLGGTIDVATRMGIPDHDTDFGITLGTWGIGEGPFLMLPLLGPAPPRDLAGRGMDILLDPLTYISFHGKVYVDAAIGTVALVDLRSRNIDTLETIERTSIDPYAATRSLYLQYRAAAIRKGEPDTEELPNF